MEELQNKFKENFNISKNQYLEFREEMKKYNSNKYSTEPDKNILTEIKNINDKSSTDDMLNIYKKIVSKEKIFKELLLYQFLNQLDSDNKLNNLEDISKFIVETLTTYQWVIGGYQIEDKYWKKEIGNSSRFKISKDDILLSNTVSFIDDDSEWFMKSLINYVKKFIDNDKISIVYKFKEDELVELTFVIIKISNKL